MNTSRNQNTRQRLALLLLVAAAAFCAGCYTTTPAVLYHGEPMSKTGLVLERPTVSVVVECEWSPQRQCCMLALNNCPDAIAHEQVMIEWGLPLIFGTQYTAPPAAAIEQYSAMLREELERVGFTPAVTGSTADCVLEVKLVNADYNWEFLLLGALPIWNEHFPVMLAAEARITTQGGLYKRRFKEIRKDAQVPDDIGPVWRRHSSQVAEAAALQFEKDRQRYESLGQLSGIDK